MNSKERVKKTLAGQLPDRVPIGGYAIDFDTVEKIIGHETYLRAKAKSKIAFWEGRHAEVAESYAKDHVELFKKLDLDIVTFPEATFAIPLPEKDVPKKTDENTWEDKAGKVYKFSESTHDISCVYDPEQWSRQYTVEQFQKPLEAPALDKRSWEILDTVIKELKDKYICGASEEIGIVFLGGIERGCIELAENPDVVKAATAFGLKQAETSDKLYLRPGLDGIAWGTDFGYKTGPMISPAMFREFFLEANKTRVRKMHELGLKVIKHSCGNNWAYLDMFLEMGYDCYQSIQPTAEMDIAEVKKKYGDKISLWGGVAVEHLIGGTMEDVRKDVRIAMEAAKPGGKF